MQNRSKTTFFVERRFKRIILDFGPDDAAKIMTDSLLFEGFWHKSIVDDDIPPRYKLKVYKSRAHLPYKLYQIYVGPNRKNLGYRVAVTFYNEALNACWIYAFKKEKQNESEEVKKAIKRAESYWSEKEEN